MSRQDRPAFPSRIPRWQWLLGAALMLWLAGQAGCFEEEKPSVSERPRALAATAEPARASDDGKPVEPQPTATPTSSNTQRRAAAKAARLEARERGAARAVRAYYRAISAGDLDQAWGRHTAGLAIALGGYQEWAAGYATTTSTRAEVLSTTSRPDGTIAVEIRLRATDLDACGTDTRQVFRGTVTAARDHGRWVFRDMIARRTYGQAPITDPDACDLDERAPFTDEDAEQDQGVQEDTGGCHPSYEGACVPDEGYDVDCPEIDGTDLTVVGPDEYRLDGDGDGIACES